jgi:ATP-dependent Clp protease ATP-binding subunit ClpA
MMNDFTPRGQQVLALARKEAERFKHNYVGTEHLLLGLIKRERVIQILCRRTKNNPVLLGEAGVGKTAIVERSRKISRRSATRKKRRSEHKIMTRAPASSMSAASFSMYFRYSPGLA